MRQFIPVLAFAVLSAACSSTSNVAKKSEVPAQQSTNSQVAKENGLPTEEKAFVKAIESLDKKTIIAHLGEPTKADDVRVKGTNKIVASIWHYHYINTGEDGEYFETTELDFIDDKVVQVVFLNNDGSEKEVGDAQSYEFPENKPSN